jgi:flagellar assembly protein FliH
MTHENSVIDPAKLAARLRAGQNRAFTSRAPLTVGEAAFKALRLDQVERVSLAPVKVVEAEWVEEPTVAAAPPEPVAPPPPDPAILLAEAQARGHAAGLTEGHAKGVAEGRAQAQAELDAAKAAFIAAAKGLSHSGPDLSDQIAALMASAVRDLAAQRAGQAIDALPRPFIARIAKLADRVAQGIRTVTLRLNPNDLTAIASHLAGTDLDGATLTPDPTLNRGDVEVRADGIRLADVLGP